MKTLKNLKKNNKGFTLIEIIIVIVIIAILAAMLIPSMISWIDKANQKTFLSACDSIKTAVNSVATENYATGTGFGMDQEASWKEVAKLTNSKINGQGSGKDAFTVTVTITNAGNIDNLTVKNAKYQCVYTDAAGWGNVDPAHS